ncbi:MAG: hypothetical protein CMK59_04985 [Proteobacteria bacterium]|nr:hypothetical protein [Pseudomonadota bacterium]
MRAQKRTGTQRWSWLLGAVGFLLTSSFLIYALRSEVLDGGWIAVGACGSILVLSWLFIERNNLQSSAAEQGFQNNLTSVVLCAMALGVVVVINLIGIRYDQRIDLTKDKRFTLSEQSIKLLESLDIEIELLAFFSTNSEEAQNFGILKDNFKSLTDKLSITTIDPLQDPILAQQYEITQDFGTIILKKGEQTIRIEDGFGEEQVVNALVRLSSGKQHNICFTTGHRELDTTDTYNPIGMGFAAQKLTGQNYKMSPINLMREGGVPDDCEVLLIAGPQSEFFPPEYEMIAKHIAQGKHLLLMIDPTLCAPLTADMERYGVLIGDDIILEQNPKYQMMGGDESYILLDENSFDFHPMIQHGSSMILMQGVRSVSTIEGIPGVQWQKLAQTTQSSWAETDYEMGLLEPTPGEDPLGPVPVLAVGEITDPSHIIVGSVSLTQSNASQQPSTTSEPNFERKPGGKMIVLGSSSLVSNAMISVGPANLDFFLNSIAWLVGEEAQLSERANDNDVPTLQLNELQALLVWIFSILIAPGIFLIGAINTWRTRRER